MADTRKDHCTSRTHRWENGICIDCGESRCIAPLFDNQCHFGVKSNSKYCGHHGCQYRNCPKKSPTGAGTGCAEHTCEHPSCERVKKEHSRWCSVHTCTYLMCYEHTDGHGPCEAHKCINSCKNIFGHIEHKIVGIDQCVRCTDNSTCCIPGCLKPITYVHMGKILLPSYACENHMCQSYRCIYVKEENSIFCEICNK